MQNILNYDKFENRHIGPSNEETDKMLSTIGEKSLNNLIDKTIPANIRLHNEIELSDTLSEANFIKHLREIAGKNKVFKSYIGQGYYDTITPAVVIRNILENPGWYTQYTPYQAEISQGRLEALLNFQTMISDLTAMPLANASLLDEGTAAAEAMSMLYSSRKGDKKNSNTFLVSEKCFPQTIDILQTRSEPLGITLKIDKVISENLNKDVFAILVQNPDDDGTVSDLSELFNDAKNKNIFIAAACDLLSLAILVPPGELGADIVIGSSQRFGIPFGYGGPHAAYFATKEEFKRHIPGRIIGVSQDIHGNSAFRMSLQTREQHIKRERATSNICTAQVLLAIMASMYAVYHGPKGIRAISERVHTLAVILNHYLELIGYNQISATYFDTLKIKLDADVTKKIEELALSANINFRYFNNGNIGISIGESTSLEDLFKIVEIFAGANGTDLESINLDEKLEKDLSYFPETVKRVSTYLTNDVFFKYRTETDLMRYCKTLEYKDLSLTTSMIPLGSCTMKLNAASEMFGITWPEFSNIHPYAPVNQALGYQELIKNLEQQINEITGFSAVSFQPNSGAQGEYTGLLVIREYHKQNGDSKRNVVLIPSSAHGTNPASAIMAGSKVVIVKCDDDGNIDSIDLKEKAEMYSDSLSAVMITYPSTHGVFEENIKEICAVVHKNGGQVYMDGANLNAQLGLTNPYEIGADVCHLNLHKTFCIPHGGGGPGMGPIAVAEHLVPFLPDHPVIKTGNEKSISAVAAAPWGSANILLISYAYIKMMGSEGLTKATKIAILNANYIKSKLEPYFKVLYKGKNGFVGHELIFDLRVFKKTANIEVEDVAKRLMDYSFHAPTVSFPVPGTLMVEPTESESKPEIDRFCEAMISIRNEIAEIEEAKADRIDNVLKNAPHTAVSTISDNWDHSYSREKAVYPLNWLKDKKFWPSVGRVDNAYGDRNLMCTCPSIETYSESEIES